MQRARRVPLLFTCATLALAALSPLPSAAHAQAAQPVRDSIVGSVSGVVRDASGQPVRDAVVYLTGQRFESRTRADGSYWLAITRPGKYTLGARKVGYRGVSDEVMADTGANRIDLEMERLPEVLASVVTRADRGGLSGLVVDERGTPVPNATVSPLGSGRRTQTNERGEFFVPVNTGKYLVRLEKPGMQRRTVSIAVPKDEGRRMVVTMAPETTRPNPRYGANLFDLNEQLLRASPVWQRLVTREELMRMGVQDAQQVARRFAASPIIDEECAKLDGGPSTAPLWAIDVQEIEFMITTTEPPPKRIEGMFPCRHTVWLRQ